VKYTGVYFFAMEIGIICVMKYIIFNIVRVNALWIRTL